MTTPSISTNSSSCEQIHGYVCPDCHHTYHPPEPEPKSKVNVISLRQSAPPSVYIEFKYKPSPNSKGHQDLKNDTENDIEIAMAKSISELTVNSSPNDAYLDFCDLLKKKDFIAARDSYDLASAENKTIIDVHLDTIPWRVSCEYYRTETTLHWIQFWVKIGWWHESECEIAPQLNEGQWYDSKEDLTYAAIDGKSFEASVCKGVGKDVIHRLIATGPKTNVELQDIFGILTPVNVAFKEPLNPKNRLDICEIEIGDLNERSAETLDIMRTLHGKIPNPDGTEIYHYKGSQMGRWFVHEHNVITPDDLIMDYNDIHSSED